jgi:folate-binding protein YgfZ
MTDLVTPEQLEQYNATRSSCGYARLGRRTQLQLSGADRATFLHAFCTADITRLASGQGCEAFITSVQGKTLGLVHVFCHQENLVLDTVAEQADTLLTHLDRYVIREDVVFTDLSETLESLFVAGPASGKTIASLLPTPLPAEPLDHVDQLFEESTLSVRRCQSSLDGYWISGPDTAIQELAGEFSRAGCREIDNVVVEMLRIEAGLPLYGVDLNERNLPQEVNRDVEAISFTKGCYLGQETVARIDALGHVNWLLTGLLLPAGTLPAAGTVFQQDGSDVARITSSSYSPRLQRPLALAHVRQHSSNPGTILQGAEVVSLPLT